MRGIAASMVVLHHAIRAFAINIEPGTSAFVLAESANWNVLIIGVDVFFVISGFIMVHTTPGQSGGRAARWFLLRRVIRIYPLYWMALLIPIAGAATVMWKTGRADPDVLDAGRVIAAAVLAPSLGSNGHIQPILGVSWTLSYEMVFYLVFALALALGRSVPFMAGAIVALVLVARATSPATALGMFLAQPVYLEFIFGMLLGTAFKMNRLPRLSPWIGVLAFVCAIPMAARWPEVNPWRFLWLGVPAAVVMWAAISNSDRPALRAANPFGAASYATYLFHMPVISWLVVRPFVYLKLETVHPLMVDAGIALSVMLSVLVGYMLHRHLEKPLQDSLSQRLRSSAPRAASAGIEANGTQREGR
nr:acyltransferase [Pelomonas sp. P8]